MPGMEVWKPATAGQHPSHETPPVRLVNAAHEFEAQTMKELMRPITASDPLTGGDDATDSGSNGALGDFATEALGRALSDRGGLGIAKTIVHELSSFGHSNASTQVTGGGYGNTV